MNKKENESKSMLTLMMSHSQNSWHNQEPAIAMA